MDRQARASVALSTVAFVLLGLSAPMAGAASDPRALNPVMKGKKIGHPQIETKPVDVGNGYGMTLSSYGSTLYVKIQKGSADSEQAYWWVFGDLDNAIKVNKKMSMVSVDAEFVTNEGVAASGSIDMTSTKDKPKGPAVMDGCSGVKFQHRDGTLTGSFVFDTGTDLFGVIESDELELEYARRSVGKSRCAELEEVVCSQNYSIAFYFGSGDMLWTAELEDGRHLLVADIREWFTNGFYMQMLREEVSASSLQGTPDLSSGSLQGGSLISGSVSYEAAGPKEAKDWGYGCGTEYYSNGTVTGDMVFNYDTGVVDPFADGPTISGRLLEGQ